MKVNMTPNPLDVVTIHASQGDTEARQWEFELHNNGELIDTSDITEQLFFKAYKGGTEQILPENGAVPVTAPFIGDIQYPDATRTDQEFLYRQSPTEKDGNAKIKSLYGNTLAWNQLLPSLASTKEWGGITITNNGDGSLTFDGTYTGESTGNLYVNPTNMSILSTHWYLYDFSNSALSGFVIRISSSVGTGTLQGHGATINRPNADTNDRLVLRIPVGATFSNVKVYPQIYDLTLMFGAEKAQELRDMEVAQAGSGVDYFRSLFPLPYYAYNQGTLLSFMGNGIKTVGKNLIKFPPFDYTFPRNGIEATISGSELTVKGTATGNTGFYDASHSNSYEECQLGPFLAGTYKLQMQGFKFVANGTRIVYTAFKKDGTRIANGASVSDGNVRTLVSDQEFKIALWGQVARGDTVDNKVTIMLTSESDVSYEPYTSSTTDLPTLTYFPTGMKSAGNVYDELTESKAITRIKQITFDGSNDENWNVVLSSHRAYNTVSDIDTSVPDTSVGNIMSNIYASGAYSRGAFDDIITTRYGIAQINIFDSVNITSSSTTATWRAYLQEHPLIVNYGIATPTETSFTTASLVTENAEIPLSNNDGVLIGKCTEQLSENPGFIDAKIKLSDADGECYSNKIQLHVERSPQ